MVGVELVGYIIRCLLYFLKLDYGKQDHVETWLDIIRTWVFVSLVSQAGHVTQVVMQPPSVPAQGPTQSSVSEQQEIPESVTAELEKLEQDGGMEGEGVPGELGDLGVDDDELLGRFRFGTSGLQ